MARFESFDGVALEYEDRGSGPPVLLLHGFAADAHGNWVAPGVVAALLDAGRRVLTVDARGHGRSDKPQDPAAYAGDAMARDVGALLDHLDVGPFDLVGYSMGSLVSARVVGAEPRVRSLVLGGMGDHLAQHRSGAVAIALAEGLEADDPSTIADPTVRAFRSFADSTGADRLALAALQRSEAGAPPDLGAVAVPTLVLLGDRDTLVGSGAALAGRIPGAVLRTIGGDHLTAVVDPAFAPAIVQFLASVDAAESASR